MVPLYHLNYIYYCDYFYQNSGNTGRYLFRGGFSVLGNDCGAFFIRANYDFSGASWYIAASISFKLLDYFLL